MAKHFGPWATAVNTGSKTYLSTFWKRRLTMLSVIYECGTRLGGRTVLFLLIGAGVLWSLPMLRSSSASATQPSDTPAATPVIKERTGKESIPDAAVKTRPIVGKIVDENGQPVEGAEVRIFAVSFQRSSEHLLCKTFTDSKGCYHLDMPREKDPRKENHRRLVVTKKGYASRVLGSYAHLSSNFKELALSKPCVLRGRITGPDGKPVAGVGVWTPGLKEMVPGICSATTDTNGYYEITDLRAWDRDKYPAFGAFGTPGPFQTVKGTGYRPLRVQHPDYGLLLAPYTKVPSTVDATFDKPAVITGRMIDKATGKPLRGVVVRLNTVRGSTGTAQAITDDQGAFRLLIQGSGEHQLSWWYHDKWGKKETLLDVKPGDTLKVKDVKIKPKKVSSSRE